MPWLERDFTRMNTSRPETIKPCPAWARLLAAGPADFTAAERAALDAHVATCAACAAARADYVRMDAQMRSLPAPAALASLPALLANEGRAVATASATLRKTSALRAGGNPAPAAHGRSALSQ